MATKEAAQWIDVLWPAVCARTRRPVAGVLLNAGAASGVAEEIFEGFLEQFPTQPGTWEHVQHWLTTRAAPAALEWVAGERARTGNNEAFRDPDRTAWERNPDFASLRRRTADGALTSRDWGMVEPILWRRSASVLTRLGVAEDDARDVFMETLAELTQARTEPGPLEKMSVFEELPRFFATMIERRGISWLRKVSAKKRQPTNPAFTDRLDDPDSTLSRTLTDPRSVQNGEPWRHANFDRIHAACRGALSEFEWHLVVALFVEGTHTRLDLAEDAWVLDHLGAARGDSESKRRRRLNLFIEEALAKLGRQLETCDI